MNSTHFVREQCRHVLHRPRISIPSNATEGCRSTQRAFSQSQISRAEDGGRIRLPKAPTRLRRQMYAWLNTKGRLFAEPSSQGTNYLSDYNAAGIRRDQTSQSRANEEVDEDEGEGPNEDAEEPTLEESSRRTSSSARTTPKHPFPRNRAFRSEPVLSEELKNAIYRRVVKDGHSISAVGAEYSVDMRRVAAVVRLKEVEKLWEKEGKQYADTYAKSVMGMLPQTPLDYGKNGHETINDLPVHPATHQQIFYPAAESRQITRRDAAKIFSPTLLPADERVPHPELIQAESASFSSRPKVAEKLRQAAAKAREAEQQKREAAEAARTTVIPGSRWNFKFEAIDATAAGKDGRGQGGVGWRYGMPFEDRKRGHLKGVPTKVEV